MESDNPKPHTDEVTINLMTMIQMLNSNINESRKEIMDALAAHEMLEMEEIKSIKSDIADLQTWKWRLVGLLGATVLLGLVQQDTINKIISLGGAL